MTLLRAKRKRRKRVKIGRRVYVGKAHMPIVSAARSKGRYAKSCGRQKAAGKNYAAKDRESGHIDASHFGDSVLTLGKSRLRAVPGPSVTLRIPEKSQPVEGRFALLLGRRPQWNRRQPHDWTPMTRQDDLVPSLGPSNKIGQMRFGFADRNIHGLSNLLPPVGRGGNLGLDFRLNQARARARRELIPGGPAARPRSPAPRALPRRPSSSAHWSPGGAKTPCFRSPPCVRQR